jgi:hypothetical protein
MVKAYKGFRSDLTCTMGRGTFQYRENEWIEEQEANCGRNGFHCCYNPLDCLSYYGDFEKSAYCLVCAGGDIHEDGSDTRISCTRIKLVKRLSLEEFVAHSLAYMQKHPNLETSPVVDREFAVARPGREFCIVRGKDPACRAPMGTVVGMAREAPDSKEIVSVTIYRVDGKEYLPDRTYFIDGKRMGRRWHEAEEN